MELAKTSTLPAVTTTLTDKVEDALDLLTGDWKDFKRQHEKALENGLITNLFGLAVLGVGLGLHYGVGSKWEPIQDVGLGIMGLGSAAAAWFVAKRVYQLKGYTSKTQFIKDHPFAFACTVASVVTLIPCVIVGGYGFHVLGESNLTEERHAYGESLEKWMDIGFGAFAFFNGLSMLGMRSTGWQLLQTQADEERKRKTDAGKQV